MLELGQGVYIVYSQYVVFPQLKQDKDPLLPWTSLECYLSFTDEAAISNYCHVDNITSIIRLGMFWDSQSVWKRFK